MAGDGLRLQMQAKMAKELRAMSAKRRLRKLSGFGNLRSLHWHLQMRHV